MGTTKNSVALINAIASMKNKEESLYENIQGNVFRRHITNKEANRKLVEHQKWMSMQQREYPMPYVPYKIGVYIRYHNQTKHENYIEKHTQQFIDDIALCPNWELVDFYIDKGAKAPRMESSKEWCRLLGDCFSGKVNLIVTQKVKSVSTDPDEMSFIARALAAQKEPVGIYFISEDIFTLASYFQPEIRDTNYLPYGWQLMPEDELDLPMFYEMEDNLLPEDTGEK